MKFQPKPFLALDIKQSSRHAKEIGFRRLDDCAGTVTRRRAAAIMGETLPDYPMADVLTARRRCSRWREAEIDMKFDQAKTVAELALNISDELNSIRIAQGRRRRKSERIQEACRLDHGRNLFRAAASGLRSIS